MIKELRFEGRYVDARLNSQGYVYIVSKQVPENRPNPIPQFNVGNGAGWVSISSEAVFYFPGEFNTAQFINVFCFNILEPEDYLKMNMVSLIFENSHELYMSAGALYLTVTRAASEPPYNEFTHIHKIFLQEWYLIPFTDAVARGRIQNQFSLDEETSTNTFRIVTENQKGDAEAKAGIFISTFDFDLNPLS